ncbi:hypothetical protein CF150_13523, partial [Pseudomonas sp. CF150]
MRVQAPEAAQVEVLVAVMAVQAVGPVVAQAAVTAALAVEPVVARAAVTAALAVE